MAPSSERKTEQKLFSCFGQTAACRRGQFHCPADENETFTEACPPRCLAVLASKKGLFEYASLAETSEEIICVNLRNQRQKNPLCALWLKKQILCG